MSPSTLFNIYCMSYQRSDKILSKHLFEYCTYVVREKEADAYRRAGIDDMLVIPEGEAWNFMSTLYWLIQHAPEDVIFVADDDIKKFIYILDNVTYLELKDGSPDKEKITSEVERIAQLIYDLDIGLAFDQTCRATYTYTSEFRFIGVPGHIRWINRKALKATYDKNDPAASDVDMMMQELLKNRIILQPKYLHVAADMDLNETSFRVRKEHLLRVDALKNKWGKYYDYNYKRNIALIKVER